MIVHAADRLAALKLRRRRQAGQFEEQFDALGPEARAFHLQLLTMPVKPTVHLRRLLALVRLYGRKEVLAAIRQAIQYQTYDAAYVEALLLQEHRQTAWGAPPALRRGIRSRSGAADPSPPRSNPRPSFSSALLRNVRPLGGIRSAPLPRVAASTAAVD